MPKAHPLFNTMKPDEAAECLDGMTTPILRKLWSFVKDYKGPTPEVSEEPCHGIDALVNFWDRLEEDEQVWLNDLAKCHMGEVCERCDTLIRPEGGHLCGTCGRDI